MDVPFKRSYWVVPGWLLAGAYPGDLDHHLAQEKLRALIDCGVRHVVNLMEEHERDASGNRFTPYQHDIARWADEAKVTVTWTRVPIKDLGIPSTVVMGMILGKIDAAIAGGKPVYVHCWGGIGRTGTVVGCYLARHAIAEGDEAIDRIQALRQEDPTASRPSPETSAQRHMVRTWRRRE